MGWASFYINLKIISETYSSTYTWWKMKRASQKSQNQSDRKRRLLRKHKDLALMHWSMFKHTLPVCQAGSDTLSWALSERGHATRSVFHTHMHTHITTGAWACVSMAICASNLPTVAGEHAAKCYKDPCMCAMCVSTILSCEEPRCSGTHRAHSSLDPSLPALMPPHIDTHPS